MIAELIAVGSELLDPERVDTNSAWLAGRLRTLGYRLSARRIVGDEVADIAAHVVAARQRADLVVLTGGLGPTDDDRTRAALAAATGSILERDAARVAALRRRVESAGRRFTEEHARQADRPRGWSWIDNPVGTAPGLLVEQQGGLLVALPGVPEEMQAMFDAHLATLLARRSGRVLRARRIKIAGRGESEVDRRVHDLVAEPGVEMTILAGRGVVELVARAAGADPAAADARLDGLERVVRERLGPDCFGVDEDTLASVCARRLVASGRTVATAESCTAGLLGAALTDVAGASAWFCGGLLVYSNSLKQSLAGVRGETLDREGAVSEAVARELAEGARRVCGADIGLAVTGIAGPGGAVSGKPVGTVHLALQDGSTSRHEKLQLRGSRVAIRGHTVVAALDLLRRHLLESP